MQWLLIFAAIAKSDLQMLVPDSSPIGSVKGIVVLDPFE